MASFDCAVCMSALVDPVTLACGAHSFCIVCARTWLARASSPTCPICRKLVPREPPQVINVVLRDALAVIATSSPVPALAVIREADLVLTEEMPVLGMGGFGVVRRAALCGTPVAVKSLLRAAADVGEAPSRAFNREMAALAQLHHPNIVRVLGVCHHDDGRVSLVQELADGGDLCARLHPQGPIAPGVPLPSVVAARIGLDVARGLAYAHARGATHNDVKSANIVFDAGGKAILVDFGFVRRAKVALPHTMQVVLSASMGTDGMRGTIAYAAPENFEDEAAAYEPPADVYSLGCLLYEMVAGRVPWAGVSLGMVIRAVGDGRRPDLPAGVDARLSALITRCWAPDPTARPRAAEAVVELASIAAGATDAAVERPSGSVAGGDRARVLEDVIAQRSNARGLVDIMRANDDDPAVALAVLEALTCITLDAAGQEAAIEAGAPMATIAAMRAHSGVVDIAHSGCYTLGVLALSASGQQVAIAAGSLPAVVAAVRAHIIVSNVAHFGFFALGVFALHPAGQQAAVAAGVSAIVIAGLRAHASVTVAHYGCFALCNISQSPAGQQAAVAAGAPTAIVTAMRAHVGVSDVAQLGCRALVNIASLSDGQQAAVAAGAPTAVVAAMRVHAGVADVALHGCRALLQVAALVPTGKAAVIAAGGHGAVTLAMARHEGARAHGADALARLGAPVYA